MPFSSTPQLYVKVAAPVTSISANTTVDRTLTVTGLTPDMVPVIHYPALDTGLGIYNVWCATANSLVIRFTNPTGAPITPAAATITVLGL